MHVYIYIYIYMYTYIDIYICIGDQNCFATRSSLNWGFQVALSVKKSLRASPQPHVQSGTHMEYFLSGAVARWFAR